MSGRDRSPAEAMLLDLSGMPAASSWLVPGGTAAFALDMARARTDATILWQPLDVRERDGLVHQPDNLAIVDLEEPTPSVEGIALVAPPDRDLARHWLLLARATLVDGGHLVVAGANAEGIRSMIGDARLLFGMPVREGYGARQRFAIFTTRSTPADDPPWAYEPGVAPGTWQEFALEWRERDLTLVTRAGVFAAGRVDAGTGLLLDALPERLDDASVLDVGCGAGVIGIAAHLLGPRHVDLVDANLLAVQAAAENVRRLGLAGCRAFASEVYDAIGAARYDLIVSNPPFHRGKAVDFTVADRLIEGAPAHLGEGGSLLLVANAFLAYGKRMARVFDEVEIVAATRRYHVIRASRPS